MIPKITSLFDLLNKAKTQPCYKELVMTTCKSMWGNGSTNTFENAVRILEDVAKQNGDCQYVIYEANKCRKHIRDTKSNKNILTNM